MTGRVLQLSGNRGAGRPGVRHQQLFQILGHDGWRIGWLVYPEGCTGTFEKLIQFNTSGGLEFMQAAAIEAIEHGEAFVAGFVEHCRTGRDIVAARLAAMPRIHPIPSQGAFYTMFEVDGMTDTYDFCKRAVHEARIGMAPGTSFGKGASAPSDFATRKPPRYCTKPWTAWAVFAA